MTNLSADYREVCKRLAERRKWENAGQLLAETINRFTGILYASGPIEHHPPHSCIIGE